MIARARLRHYGVPPLKVRRYARTFKGEPVDRAVAILELQSSPTCQALTKLLKSAMANAQNNREIAAENLVVSNILVDPGMILKRIKPRARGRAYRIAKRSCHVTIELDLKKGITLESEVEPEQKKPRKRATRKPASKEAEVKAAKPAEESVKKEETKKPARKKAAAKPAAKRTSTKKTAEESKKTRTTKKAAETKVKPAGKKPAAKPASKSAGKAKKGEDKE
jgi:large subunit ribosomal protein L22